MNNLFIGLAFLATTTLVEPDLIGFYKFCQEHNGREDDNLGALRKAYLHQPITHSGTHYCRAPRVPFVKLIVSPEQFNNKLIKIKGYLNNYGPGRIWLEQKIGLDGSDNEVMLEVSKFFKGMEFYPNGSTVEAIGIFRISELSNSRILGSLTEASIKILVPPDGVSLPIEGFTINNDSSARKIHN